MALIRVTPTGALPHRTGNYQMTFTAPKYTAEQLQAKIAAAVETIMTGKVGSMEVTQAGYAVAGFRRQLNQLLAA